MFVGTVEVAGCAGVEGVVGEGDVGGGCCREAVPEDARITSASEMAPQQKVLAMAEGELILTI